MLSYLSELLGCRDFLVYWLVTLNICHRFAENIAQRPLPATLLLNMLTPIGSV